MDLLCNVLVFAMNEATYPADLAQLGFSLYSGDRGLVIKLHGLDHKLRLLLETILDAFNTIEEKVNGEQFEAIKEQVFILILTC